MLGFLYLKVLSEGTAERPIQLPTLENPMNVVPTDPFPFPSVVQYD